MNLAPIVALVGQRIGFDPDALGANVFQTAAIEHMAAIGCADAATYAASLMESAGRFQDLVERLVVCETWFFRGAELFDALPALLAERSTRRPARLLSLPCSSGEEPHTLALALLEAGLPSERWRIEALDLSAAALDRARAGVYREFSFRQTPATIRQRYFRRAGADWELDPSIRRLVTFGPGNILDDVPPGTEAYDLILCRNLLIYLTPEARQRALANLEDRLAPGGLLALGHAEPQLVAGRAFERVGAEACFLFRRQAVRPGAAPRAPTVQTFSGSPLPRTRARGVGGEGDSSPCKTASISRGMLSPSPPTPSPRVQGRGEPPEPLCQQAPTATLERARALADANRLDEALVECRALLSGAGPSAAAFSLLGVVQQARGDLEEAGEAFRKALYLDPVCGEALTHAMLLAAQRGDTVRAAALRARLARRGPGGEP